MKDEGFFSESRNKIKKLIIKRLRERYIPKFEKELGEKASTNEIENLFQNFLHQIQSSGFMDKMIQNFYEIELNQKMSGLSLKN